ncbi:MAG: hypothetical protein RL154_888 [Pseudomonadota bacterium]
MFEGVNLHIIAKAYKKIVAHFPQFALLLIALPITLYYINYQSKLATITLYSEAAENMRKDVSRDIKAKQESIYLIGLTASCDKAIKNIALQKQDSDYILNLTNVLSQVSNYKHIWFQVINKDGISVFRTWSHSVGDDLKKMRPDVADFLENPKATSTISIGKYDMTYKTLLPIYDGTTFIGIFEVIAKFNSIAKKLSEEGIECLVVGDKKYRAQLTEPFSKLFINDYYIANENANENIVNLVKQVGIENILSNKKYAIYGNYLVTTYRQIDSRGKPLGYFILFKPLSSISTRDIELNQNISISVATLIYIIIAMLLAYFYKQKEVSETIETNRKLEIMVSEKTQELESQKNEMQYNASHDSLTGLANRAYFLNKLDSALSLAKMHDSSFAVLFIDLDGFKQINDNYGHEAGDNLLQDVAKKLLNAVRDADTVARFGGDEFVILLDNFETKKEYLSGVIQRILKQIQEQICHIDTHGVTCSIGVSIFPKDGDNVDMLINSADSAMYVAKRSGKNCYHFSSTD